MATIKDVARVAEVSIATVSRVINNGPKVGDKTRAKVFAVMQELGYTPNANARALVTQTSTTIGVVIPDLTDPFFASLASGVDKVARANNMQLLLSTSLLSAESELQAINLLLERRCDAFVVHSKKLTDEQLIELAERVPGLILIDRHIESLKHRCVWLNNAEGGRIAARHLDSLKHKRFACITSKYQIDDPAIRLTGFDQELASLGHQLSEQLTVAAEPNQQGGEIATQELIAKKQPFSAIFVYNDAMAIGAISTLEDNGFQVPNDVSVIGFDDVLLSRYSRPRLTTLHYPIEKMAQQAAELALANRNMKETKAPHSDDEGHVYLPRLVKRESTSTANN